MTPYTPDELIRFIEATGESVNIDAKGPMEWDGGEASAGLTKDILSFANSRDGGVIVIGKEELSGNFVLRGLTTAQADSFETTKVATWVNNHCEPPVHVVCHRVQHDRKDFIVLTVAEFDDVPIICTKQFELPGKPAKVILRKGTIYVRTSNAESAPLSSVDQLRTLVGLATKKRGQEMLVMFESMLKGRPLVTPPSDEEQFEKELHRIEGQLGQGYEQAIQSGAWQLIVHPSSYNPERWPDAEHLEEIIRRRSVRLRDEFPAHYRGTHMREWGVRNDTYRGCWTLARSGQFVHVRPYGENQSPFKSPWQNFDGTPTEPEIAAGKWIDFKPAIFAITEMLLFAARLVEEYEPGEEVALFLRATSLSGRTLVTTDFDNILLPDAEPCKARLFQAERKVPVEEFRAEWETVCAETMKRFVELFPGPHIELKTLQGWIKRFKERQF
jgi:Putative DNA-binding domain